MLEVGIVGLPNAGKSSLFNALTAQQVPAESFPFCTVEPNVGIVEVPDPRLATVQQLYGSRDRIPVFIRFVDIAGLVRGASRGEGLGNRFLAHIREVDAVVHVLRAFGDPEVAHVMGAVDPLRDREVVETELALADLETVEGRLERVEKKARSGEQPAVAEQRVLQRLKEALERGTPVRRLALSPEERAEVRSLQLLTAKPVIYVLNVDEGDLPWGGAPAHQELSRSLAAEEGASVVALAARLEAELARMGVEERAAFLRDLGLGEAGLPRLVRAAYEALDLVTFFTANEKQARAWTAKRGTRAPQAAGLVHSDFEKGFIRAETIGFPELVAHGSFRAAREKGAVRSEGRDYEVRDGDILLFRWHG